MSRSTGDAQRGLDTVVNIFNTTHCWCPEGDFSGRIHSVSPV